MAELQLIKHPGGILRPANLADDEALQRIQNGKLVLADIKQPRNPTFHRRFFALLNFGFEYWNPLPVEIDGRTFEAEKNFDRFRKDVLILAGYRKVVVNIKNEARYEAESISFANMDETQFREVYRAVFSVLWRLVLQHVKGMTEEVAQKTMEDMLRFE
jgi:hypothetical protein